MIKAGKQFLDKLFLEFAGEENRGGSSQRKSYVYKIRSQQDDGKGITSVNLVQEWILRGPRVGTMGITWKLLKVRESNYTNNYKNIIMA